MLIHTISLGHVLVAEKTTIGNIGSVDSGREKEESQDTYNVEKKYFVEKLFWHLFKLFTLKN